MGACWGVAEPVTPSPHSAGPPRLYTAGADQCVAAAGRPELPHGRAGDTVAAGAMACDDEQLHLCALPDRYVPPR